MIGTSRLSSSSVALPSAEAARTFRTASLKFSLAIAYPKDTGRKKIKQDGGDASIALDKDRAVWHSFAWEFRGIEVYHAKFILRDYRGRIFSRDVVEPRHPCART